MKKKKALSKSSKKIKQTKNKKQNGVKIGFGANYEVGSNVLESYFS